MVPTKHEVHQYKRVNLEKSIVYRCVIPGCSHYVRKAFIINRIAVCPYCGKNYVITPKIAQLKTLHCNDCTNSKKIKPEEVNEFLVDLSTSEDNNA